MSEERPTFVSHLECSATGERYEADQVHGLSRAGKPLFVRYALDRIKDALTKTRSRRGRRICGAIANCCR